MVMLLERNEPFFAHSCFLDQAEAGGAWMCAISQLNESDGG